MLPADHPFAAVPGDARAHLSLLFYEAVLAVAGWSSHDRERTDVDDAEAAADGMLREYPFLGGYLDEVAPHVLADAAADDAPGWLRDRRVEWEEAVATWLPLRGMRAALGLGEAHVLAVVVAGLVEEDARFGRVFAALQGATGTRRPTVAVVGDVVRSTALLHTGDAWDLCRPLIEAGLLEVVDREVPRADWRLRVPTGLWSVIRGDIARVPAHGVVHTPVESLEPLSSMVLAPGERDRLAALHVLLESGSVTAVVVRGMPGADRMGIMGALARALGRGLLECTVPAGTTSVTGALATLLHALPVLVLELGPGEVHELTDWPGYTGPVGVLLGHDGGLSGKPAQSAVTLVLEPEPPSVRAQHWRRALPDLPAERCAMLARAFTSGGLHIRHMARRASAYRSLNGGGEVSEADVRQAARSINRQQLDSLATALPDGGGWDRLVLHPSTTAELRRLQQRCRHRERLSELLADDMPGGLNRGVRGLFQGPSGTGKTLAARVVASELGLDLYRVDLASVVNKYIGETEKNLSRILSRAEDLDVVLLLDEGDSLMGKRTEVRSANDRWANLETNYLLQRLETYTGVVIVTTNAPGSIDAAFQRRMDVVVSFHLPEPDERWHLWQLHLPLGHSVPAATLADAAVRFALTGGQIRNAAVHATLLADDGDGLPGAGELMAAVEAEYRKAGASFPRRDHRDRSGQGVAMAAFLDSVR